MQEVNSNTLIKKVLEYASMTDPWLINEILGLNMKIDIICNQFHLPLEKISDYSVTQKMYFNFFILEVKDSDGNTLGIRIVTDTDKIYQVTFLEMKENNRTITKVEEYMIKDGNLDLLVEFQSNQNDQENIFVIEFDKTDRKISSCSILLESVVAEIYQAIEVMLGQDNMKIYQIRRSEKILFDEDGSKISLNVAFDDNDITDAYHEKNNIVNYQERKIYRISRQIKGD